MTAVVEQTKKKTTKKAAKPVDDSLTGTGLNGESGLVDGEVTTRARVSSTKPGEPGYDWQAEYPDEDVYVYTTKSGDVTVGLTKLGPNRKPKPGVLRRVNAESREAGNAFPVLWYFLELASSSASLKAQELLDDDEYAEMLKQWTEFSGIDLGE